MSENMDNTFLEEENVELTTEPFEEDMKIADNDQERITPLNKIVSNIKSFTHKMPKFVLPQIPAGKVNHPLYFFPKLPKNTSSGELASGQYGTGSSSCNYWFFILLQLIIILFLIKWLYCTCGRNY